jgi:NADH dehydrogenase/NADH:ubiquinone oxidoreductase subunit G
MEQTITLTIDGKSVTLSEEMTLLKAAEQAGVVIPTICFHDYTTANALCRICVVEVEGLRALQPACVVKASQGMQVHTQSERVLRSRRTILEMLASSINLAEAPEIQAYLHEYAADEERFPGAKRRELDLIDDNPMFIRDYSQCILCWRCVQVCAEDAQYTFAINFSGRGFDTQIDTFFGKPMPETSCVFCGQCLGVCPTGALKPKREWLLEQGTSADEIMSLTRSERRRRMRRSQP